MSSSTKITLTSKDDETFEIDEAAALQSGTIKFLIEDGVADNPIPVPNVTGKILAKVIEYCKKHADAASSDDKEKPSEDELKNWDTEFVNVDRGMLFELVLAANYLNIKDLLELTCATIANIIKGKTSEEIRQTFNIVNDFSPEEEEEIRKENEWAFE